MISSSVVCSAAILFILLASITSAQTIVSYGKCITPNEEDANCILLEECTFLYKKLFNPNISTEEKQFLSRSQCGSNDGKIFICCPDRHVGEQQPEVTFHPLLPKPGICGNALSSRSYGGSVTKFTEFPWTVLIEYDKGDGRVGHHCGGSLINNRYVLTVAHCLVSLPVGWRTVRVRLGEWDTSTDRDCLVDTRGLEECADAHVDVPIEKAITHPDYVSTSKNKLNDIALLRLSHNVTYTSFIKPICLPLKNSLKSVSLTGIVMDIAGWGATEESTASKIKMKVDVPGASLSDCQKMYDTSRHRIQLENSHLCAGGVTGVGTCRGDSGGALIALDRSNKSEVYYYAAGVLSFGPAQCGLKGWPSVYTKVISYTDWILQNIEP